MEVVQENDLGWIKFEYCGMDEDYLIENFDKIERSLIRAWEESWCSLGDIFKLLILLDILLFWLHFWIRLKKYGCFQRVRSSNNSPQNFQTFTQISTSSRRLLNALRAFLCVYGTVVA